MYEGCVMRTRFSLMCAILAGVVALVALPGCAKRGTEAESGSASSTPSTTLPPHYTDDPTWDGSLEPVAMGDLSKTPRGASEIPPVTDPYSSANVANHYVITMFTLDPETGVSSFFDAGRAANKWATPSWKADTEVEQSRFIWYDISRLYQEKQYTTAFTNDVTDRIKDEVVGPLNDEGHIKVIRVYRVFMEDHPDTKDHDNMYLATVTLVRPTPADEWRVDHVRITQ